MMQGFVDLIKRNKKILFNLSVVLIAGLSLPHVASAQCGFNAVGDYICGGGKMATVPGATNPNGGEAGGGKATPPPAGAGPRSDAGMDFAAYMRDLRAQQEALEAELQEAMSKVGTGPTPGALGFGIGGTVAGTLVDVLQQAGIDPTTVLTQEIQDLLIAAGLNPAIIYPDQLADILTAAGLDPAAVLPPEVMQSLQDAGVDIPGVTDTPAGGETPGEGVSTELSDIIICISEIDDAGSSYCAQGVANILESIGAPVQRGNASDWLDGRMEAQGYTEVSCQPASCPDGTILIYDDSGSTNGGGAQYGHIEIVATDSGGSRHYVSDASRTNWGGTVPGNFAKAYQWNGTPSYSGWGAQCAGGGGG